MRDVGAEGKFSEFLFVGGGLARGAENEAEVAARHDTVIVKVAREEVSDVFFDGKNFVQIDADGIFRKLYDGVVKAILVENGELVEYGQDMFIIG